MFKQPELSPSTPVTGAPAIKPLAEPSRPELSRFEPGSAQAGLRQSANVEELDIKQFSQQVLNPERPGTRPTRSGTTFVLLKADEQYCKPCPEYKDAYREIADSARAAGSNARFVEVDLTQARSSRNIEQIDFHTQLADVVRRQTQRNVEGGLPLVLKIVDNGQGVPQVSVAAYGIIQDADLKDPAKLSAGRAQLRSALGAALGETR